MSVLKIVDLGGSERPKRTQTTAAAFEEGRAINLCLFTLRQVLAALANGEKDVHYRDSILTTYLHGE